LAFGAEYFPGLLDEDTQQWLLQDCCAKVRKLDPTSNFRLRVLENSTRSKAASSNPVCFEFCRSFFNNFDCKFKCKFNPGSVVGRMYKAGDTLGFHLDG